MKRNWAATTTAAAKTNKVNNINEMIYVENKSSNNKLLI